MQHDRQSPRDSLELAPPSTENEKNMHAAPANPLQYRPTLKQQWRQKYLKILDALSKVVQSMKKSGLSARDLDNRSLCDEPESGARNFFTSAHLVTKLFPHSSLYETARPTERSAGLNQDST
jgi:hypothetical protein